jgi:hypothetical protein
LQRALGVTDSVTARSSYGDRGLVAM